VRELERVLNKMMEGMKQASTERMNLMGQQASPAPAPAPGVEPVYTGEKMSVNFENIPTRRLLQLIGDTSGRNMLIDEAVTGSITLRLDGVPWDHLLDIVLQTKGLGKRLQGDLIIVGPAEKLAAMDQAELVRQRVQDAAAQSPTR
jgi:type IV pilus assembly protein PilQ